MDIQDLQKSTQSFTVALSLARSHNWEARLRINIVKRGERQTAIVGLSSEEYPSVRMLPSEKIKYMCFEKGKISLANHI